MKRKTIKLGGYSLPLVLGLLAMLAAALGVFMSSVISSTKVTKSMIERRQSFYTCDSIVRAVIIHSNDYLRTTPSPVPADLVTYVQNIGGAGLANLVPNSNYRVNSFEAEFDPTQIVNGPLPSGPFAGMQARQVPVEFKLEAEHTTSGFKCGEKQGVTLAQISLFQFIVFSDTYTDTDSGSTARFFGRTHVNGDFCAYGAGVGNAPGSDLTDISVWNLGPYHDFVTASGRIMNGSDSRCRDKGAPISSAGIAFPVGPAASATNVFALSNSTDNDCTNCDGTGNDWRDYAIARFNSRVQDQAHGVPVLRPPVAAETEIQPGYLANVDSGAGIAAVTRNNVGGMKFLVDPFRPGRDSSATADEKYACKADIRIIDGTWFLKDLTSADLCGGWPGIPIWSDHRVLTMTATSHPELIATDIPVGRDGTPYVTANKYSAYDFDPGATILPTPGVVSYGTLLASGSNNTRSYTPGFVSTDPGSSATTISSINTTSFATAKADLLKGTQSGFANGHILVTSRPGASGSTFSNNDQKLQANVLPMNFDVALFQEALADNSIGELGSHFPPSRPFNGIVYITSTWDGSSIGYDLPAPTALGGVGGVHPTMPPLQGNRNSIAPTLLPSIRQENVPYPLCSSVADNQTGIANPACPTTPPNGAQVNALRIINARNINYNLSGAPSIPTGVPRMLPEGLSIVSNLPVYLLGDINSSSEPDNPVASKTGDGTPGNEAWFPVMVGGDTVSLLSNNWDDQNAGWDSGGGANNSYLSNVDRCPNPTTYNFQMLTGWAPSNGGSSSGGIINLPQFLEDWRTDECPGPQVAATIRGSLVAGFARTHATGWGSPDEVVYTRPVRDWAFDDHLQTLDNQPPGAPLFDVSAITQWSRF